MGMSFHASRTVATCHGYSDYYRTGLCGNDYPSVNARVTRVDLIDSTQKTRINAIFFNGIVLIEVACSSFPCTLSLYNAFMWTVCVKAAQSELNESDGRHERRMNVRSSVRLTADRHERHHVVFLNVYIDMFSLHLGEYIPG